VEVLVTGGTGRWGSAGGTRRFGMVTGGTGSCGTVTKGTGRLGTVTGGTGRWGSTGGIGRLGIGKVGGTVTGGIVTGGFTLGGFTIGALPGLCFFGGFPQVPQPRIGVAEEMKSMQMIK
jgi:hypothetical protein